MNTFSTYLDQTRDFVWGPIILFLIFGVGIYLTVVLRGVQFRYLFYALKLTFTRHDDDAKGDVSHFQALTMVLAATIGIGNIAGVATAIAIGGLGSLFWMWITAFLGMATKYSEAILAIKYRTIDKKKGIAGGPMYYMEKGLGWKWCAIAFSVFGVIATLGTGNMVQANSIADVVHDMFNISHLLTGIILAVAVGLVLIKGIKSIGSATAFIVPIMAFVYLIGGIIVLIIQYDQVPAAFMLIIKSAFTGQAAFGGFMGATIMMALRMGVARSVFTHESGLGTSPIAAAAAKTDVPGRQAMVSMTSTFLSTIVVCTITGLVIAVTNVLGQTEADGSTIAGIKMTVRAFSAHLPGGQFIVLFGAIFFGYSTIIGWAYYGEKCIEYLFGEKSIIAYRIFFTAMVIAGPLMSLGVVWALADIANAFMAVPNLIALIALSGVTVAETKSFLKKVKSEKKPHD